MIKNNPTSEKTVSNFLDYICEDELEAIKPEAVNIIRWYDRYLWQYHLGGY